MSTITSDTFTTLREKIRGELILPDSLRYDEARTIWNAMISCSIGAVGQGLTVGRTDSIHKLLANTSGLVSIFPASIPALPTARPMAQSSLRSVLF
jgi:hypothetical protein